MRHAQRQGGMQLLPLLQPVLHRPPTAAAAAPASRALLDGDFSCCRQVAQQWLKDSNMH